MSTLQRGELGQQDRIHWEHPEFRVMFQRNITPSDFDGWLGWTDLAGSAGGPFIVFEFKRYWANDSHGQAEGFKQLRDHLKASDWWIRVEHQADDHHVWPAHVTKWAAFRCGCTDGAKVSGWGSAALSEFVRTLDPFGVPAPEPGF